PTRLSASKSSPSPPVLPRRAARASPSAVTAERQSTTVPNTSCTNACISVILLSLPAGSFPVRPSPRPSPRKRGEGGLASALPNQLPQNFLALSVAFPLPVNGERGRVRGIQSAASRRALAGGRRRRR